MGRKGGRSKIILSSLGKNQAIGEAFNTCCCRNMVMVLWQNENYIWWLARKRSSLHSSGLAHCGKAIAGLSHLRDQRSLNPAFLLAGMLDLLYMVSGSAFTVYLMCSLHVFFRFFSPSTECREKGVIFFLTQFRGRHIELFICF